MSQGEIAAAKGARRSREKVANTALIKFHMVLLLRFGR
jgi:hypothetical protein